MPGSRMPDHEVHGDGDTTLFLLHGAYGSKEYFRDLTAALVGAGLRVVAWDAPGYGLSPLPAEGLAIPDMAEAAARLVEHAGSATNVVLGHSKGGIIAPAPTSPFQPVRSMPLKSGVKPAAFRIVLAIVTAAPPSRSLSSAASMKARISSVSAAVTGATPVRKNRTISSTRCP